MTLTDRDLADLQTLSLGRAPAEALSPELARALLQPGLASVLVLLGETRIASEQLATELRRS